MEIRFPRNHFGFIVSAEMAFPLFRIRSRAAETSTKKFVLVTHAKLVGVLFLEISRTTISLLFYFTAHIYAFAIGIIEVRSILFCQLPLTFLYI